MSGALSGTPRHHLGRFVGVTALAVSTLVAVAPTAEATGSPAPRTYTASLQTPTTPIARGVPTPFQIKITNTSTSISALDRIRLTIPAGFTVTPGLVAAPRGGWTESLSGSTLTVATKKPLTSALRRAEFLTFAFSATAAPTSCAALNSTWSLAVDGIFLVYTMSSAPLTTSVPAVADTFAVTSVPDVDEVLAGKQVTKDVPFSVSGEFRCGGTAAPAGAAGAVSLEQSSPGTPSGAVLTSSPQPVASTDTEATISGATLDQAANGVGLNVKWNTTVSGSLTLDVLGATKTAPGGDEPINLTVPGATASLGNGSNGPVSLAVVACDPTDEAPVACSDGTEIALTGDFKDLYSNEDPASLTWVCSAADCPHIDATRPPSFFPPPTPNCVQLFSCYQSSSKPFGLRDVEEDFADYPVWVSMSDGEGGYLDFGQAGRCVSTPTISEGNWGQFSYYVSVVRPHFLLTTGVIEDPDAQEAGFCVDVNAITRDSETGALSIPVLFVEDPRLRP